MSPMKRTVLLWVLVMVIFAAFNAVYWPVWRYQRDRDPARFQAFAANLAEQGDVERAVHVLQQGLREFRPPLEAPYIQLRRYLNELGRTDEAANLDPDFLFYHGNAQENLEQRLHYWSQAVEAALVRQPAPELDPMTAEAAERFAIHLAGVYGLGDAVAEWTAAEQVALLRIAGGLIRSDGRIGNTGVTVPTAILVQSGGGTGVRRVAHIFVGGRDYAGAARGWHVALIEPVSGRVIQWGAFDLWASEAEAARMTHFLNSADPGTIAALAVLDEGSVNLTAELDATLRDYGLYPGARIEREFGMLGIRYSFAAIGVKGSGQGTALQVWSPDTFQGEAGHPVVCGVLAAGGTGE